MIAKGMRKVRKKLPKDLALYLARHTFATDMLDRTGNLALVQKILGNESILTTQRICIPNSRMWHCSSINATLRMQMRIYGTVGRKPRQTSS